MAEYWREEMQRRFPDRPDLGREEAYRRFWEPAQLPQADVFAVFDLIEQEYRLSAGLLRPDDPMEALLPPVRTRNPLRWLACEPRLEDAASELSYQLGKRMKQGAAVEPTLPLQTVQDLVRAWCGLQPHSDSSTQRPDSGEILP